MPSLRLPLLPALLAIFSLGCLGASAEFEPIKFPKKAKTQRDFLRAQRAWCERVLVEPFRERAKGKPWADRGTTFVSHALDSWPGDRLTMELPELSAEGQALLAGGCNDPLVGYLATWARWQATEEYYGSRESFAKLLKDAEKLPRPNALARLIARDFIRANQVVKLGFDGVPQKLADLTAASWTDGSYLPEEDFLFLRHVVPEPWDPIFENYRGMFMKALKGVELPPWVRETLAGTLEIHEAWKRRGGGYADAVTEDGWKGFREHLDKAHNHLLKGWRMRKDQPIAAAGMISVAMGSDQLESETPRLWFDRAIAAECDYFPAYRQLATSMLPRWGGSNELLIEFGKACVATGRFDTRVPLGLFIALSFAGADLPDMQLYRDPEIAPSVSRLLEGFAAEPSYAEEKSYWIARQAIQGWWTGDAAAASKALSECGPGPLQRGAAILLHDMGVDENTLRAEIQIQASPVRAQFEQARTQREAGEYAEAAKTFLSAAADTSGLAAARLRALAGIVEVERKLDAGEWATIPPDPTLSGWTQRRGTWFATPEGYPAIRDADGPVRIVYGAQVGSDFEMRGVIDVSGEPQAKWAGGIVFGDQGEREGRERWYESFVRIDKGDKQGTGRCYFRHYVLAFPGKKCPWKESNEFQLRLEGGKLTWSVNGTEINHGIKLEELIAESRIGLCSFRHFSGVTLSLRKLEVRKLNGK